MKAKALALVSGGLDSRLAASLIKRLGIGLAIFNLKTPFCMCDKKNSTGSCSESAKAAIALGVEFRSKYITDEFFRLVEKPKFGYGSNINPCIDCRILLLKKAKEAMPEMGASFIVTGEVLGQRPMSQHKNALRIIEREAGLEGLVLRPLSAGLLPETIPEREGWVDRKALLSFCGRGRRPQMDLAKLFEVNDYPCPAGGCLLTDPGFTDRLKDLMRYGKLNLNEVELLKVGRHFRLAQNLKLVVGRNKKENERLLNLSQEKDYLFMPKDIAGPTALGRGEFNDELIKISCGIIARYSDTNGALSADIVYEIKPSEEKILAKTPALEDSKIQLLRV